MKQLRIKKVQSSVCRSTPPNRRTWANFPLRHSWPVNQTRGGNTRILLVYYSYLLVFTRIYSYITHNYSRIYSYITRKIPKHFWPIIWVQANCRTNEIALNYRDIHVKIWAEVQHFLCGCRLLAQKWLKPSLFWGPDQFLHLRVVLGHSQWTCVTARTKKCRGLLLFCCYRPLGSGRQSHQYGPNRLPLRPNSRTQPRYLTTLCSRRRLNWTACWRLRPLGTDLWSSAMPRCWVLRMRWTLWWATQARLWIRGCVTLDTVMLKSKKVIAYILANVNHFKFILFWQ